MINRKKEGRMRKKININKERERREERKIEW